MSEQRISNLEVQLSFQEKTVQELNEVVIRQGHEIDILKRQVQLLTEKMKEMTPGVVKPESEETPPPHY